MRRLPFAALAILIVLIDAWTKRLVMTHFTLNDAVTVIPDFFQLVYVQNSGAAFGIGANSASALVPLLLNGGALVVFLVVVAYSLRASVNEQMLQVGLHLIVGGAVGNLIDRFRFGSVVDFLDFYVVNGGEPHHWPAFNVADSAICIGIVCLFLDMRRSAARETVQAS